MRERFLYSNVWPLPAKEGQEIIYDRFKKEMKQSDQLDISVGFCSCASLRVLDRLVRHQKIKNVCLILGMYYFNGFPKPLRELALLINKKWQKAGIGEIRVINSCKYHGKLYCFIKENQIFSAILGSPNLSFLDPKEFTSLYQYEIAFITNNSETLENAFEHMQNLKSKIVSENIEVLERKNLLSDPKPSLQEIEKALLVKSFSQNH